MFNLQIKTFESERINPHGVVFVNKNSKQKNQNTELQRLKPGWSMTSSTDNVH